MYMYIYMCVYMYVHNMHMTAVHVYVLYKFSKIKIFHCDDVTSSSTIPRSLQVLVLCFKRCFFVDNAAALIDYWANAHVHVENTIECSRI